MESVINAREPAAVVSNRDVLVVDQEGALTRMPSSWIEKYEYNNSTQVLTMFVQGGNRYEWGGIPPTLAQQILGGAAVCRTDDPTGQGRWWHGKHPSLGAAYWRYLRPLGPGRRTGGSAVRPTRVGGLTMADTLTPRLQRPGLMSPQGGFIRILRRFVRRIGIRI